MSSLLGSSTKSKSVQQSTSNASSNSFNQAYPGIASAFSPVMNQTAQTGDFMSQLLGMKGDAGANDAFQKYLGSTGYQFQMDQGSKAITNNAASRGLLDSGATGKALTTYGQNTGGQYFNQFLQQLLGLGNQGLQAGQVVGGAGQVSNSNSSSNSYGKSTSGSGSGLMGIPSMLGA